MGNPSFLTRIEQVDPDLQTFAVVDWLPLGGDDSGGPLISDAVDTLIAFDGYDGGFAAAGTMEGTVETPSSRSESSSWPMARQSVRGSFPIHARSWMSQSVLCFT